MLEAPLQQRQVHCYVTASLWVPSVARSAVGKMQSLEHWVREGESMRKPLGAVGW